MKKLLLTLALAVLALSVYGACDPNAYEECVEDVHDAHEVCVAEAGEEHYRCYEACLDRGGSPASCLSSCNALRATQVNACDARRAHDLFMCYWDDSCEGPGA